MKLKLENKKRKANITEALIPLVSLGLLLSIGGSFFKIDTTLLLIAACIPAFIIALLHGISWNDMLNSISEKIEKVFPAILILISVGFLIGAWIYSGTIPYMVYLGIRLISWQYVIAASFVITAIVSTVTGTSWGAAGTIGVALMGVAITLNVNSAATAGAIVTGAYFGDKISPLSDTTNLASVVAGCDIFEHIKHLLYTTLPSALIAFFIYLIFGLSNMHMSPDAKSIELILTRIESIFTLSPILLIPAILIFVGAYKKLPAVPLMLGSGVIALAVGILVQNFPFSAGMESVLNGFSTAYVSKGSAAETEVISSLLNRGGMIPMMKTMLMIIAAFSFIGILHTTQTIQTILNQISKLAKSTGTLTLSTVISRISVEMITGLSYISIIIPGELFRSEYKQRGLAAKNLSRTLEDAGTMIAPLVPWSTEGAYMAATLGVATIDYLPWSILSYTGICFALLYGFTGFGIAGIQPKKRLIKKNKHQDS